MNNIMEKDNKSQGSPKKINLSLFSGAPENSEEFSWESNNTLTSYKIFLKTKNFYEARRDHEI